MGKNKGLGETDLRKRAGRNEGAAAGRCGASLGTSDSPANKGKEKP